MSITYAYIYMYTFPFLMQIFFSPIEKTTFEKPYQAVAFLPVEKWD